MKDEITKYKGKEYCDHQVIIKEMKNIENEEDIIKEKSVIEEPVPLEYLESMTKTRFYRYVNVKVWVMYTERDCPEDDPTETQTFVMTGLLIFPARFWFILKGIVPLLKDFKVRNHLIAFVNVKRK